ncbi:MAG: hypothetical protein ACI4ML_07680 [Aristaeellaceae bacterium]
MKAVHRVMGNFPARGYGVSLSTPGFSYAARTVSGSNARLPQNDAGIGRVRASTAQVTEAYHAWELHPMAYGVPAVFRSATVCVRGARACSYTDIAVPAGEDVPALSSQEDFLAHVLRFSAFMPAEEFWSLDKRTTTLHMDAWTEDDASVLTLPRPVPMTEDFRRALTAHYWRCASLQFFGPWSNGAHDALRYASDPVLAPLCARPRNITLCLGEEDGCDGITALARAFLWQELLPKLPPAVRNIASMAAAVPMQYAASMYADAALCVIYPNGQGKPCFHPGKRDCCLPITGDEAQMMAAVMREPCMPWMNPVAEAFCRLRGMPASLADHCELKADYDLCLTLWRLTHTDAPPFSTLADWYALRQHLQLRHGLRAEETDQVLRPVEGGLLARLSAGTDALTRALSGEDKPQVKRTLLAFLWERTLHCPSSQHRQLAALTCACQKPEAAAFFTDFPSARDEGDAADAEVQRRRAGLISRILCTDYVDAGLPAPMASAFLRDAALYTASEPVSRAMQDYFRLLIAAHPDWQARLLPLSALYLPREEAVSGAIRRMQEQERLPDGAELRCLRDAFCDACLPQLNDYYLYLLRTRPAETAARVMAAVAQDATMALCRWLDQTDGAAPEPDALRQLLGRSIPFRREAVLSALYQSIHRAMAHRQFLMPEDWLAPFLRALQAVHTAVREALAASGVPGDLPAQLDAWFSRETAGWLLQLYTAHPSRPEPEYAFPALLHALDTHPAGVLGLYEQLLRTGVPDLEDQLERLLTDSRVPPLPLHPEETPRLLTYTRALLLDRLTAAWQRDGLLQGLERQRTLLALTGLSDTDLTGAPMEAALQAVRHTCRRKHEPQAWLDAARRHDGQLRRLQALLPGGSALLTDAYERTAYECLCGALPSLMESLRSLEEAAQLQGFLVRLRPADVSPAPAESGLTLLAELNRMHAAPRAFTVDAAFASLSRLRQLQPGSGLCAACRATFDTVDGTLPFPCRVWLALMHALLPEGFDWGSFMTALEPRAEQLCARPLTEESLPLMAAISAGMAVLADHDGGMGLAASLADWLKSTAPYAACTEQIRRHQARFFVVPERSATLRRWLSLPEGSQRR